MMYPLIQDKCFCVFIFDPFFDLSVHRGLSQGMVYNKAHFYEDKG